ncbi:hypothetical protein ACO0LD_03300 [Undibacterium sp. Ji83W]|uniref:hypothetical protein n=1 Tax=Undibacterium sp. Ji83W TaxID=3413043 RepID=UPI003BF01C19
MSLRKRRWKSVRATSLSEAMELCVEYAGSEQRRPIKVLADLMGVDVKRLYRWLGETSMPLNRIRQFEAFCGATFVSDYLCLAHGDKVVVAIAAGKTAKVTDLVEVQACFSEAMALLSRFYQNGDAIEQTLAALTTTLGQLAYQRSNVTKACEPELELFNTCD